MAEKERDKIFLTKRRGSKAPFLAGLQISFARIFSMQYLSATV